MSLETLSCLRCLQRTQFLLLQNTNTCFTSLPSVDTQGKKNMVSFPHISSQIPLKPPLLSQVSTGRRAWPRAGRGQTCFQSRARFRKVKVVGKHLGS